MLIDLSEAKEFRRKALAWAFERPCKLHDELFFFANREVLICESTNRLLKKLKKVSFSIDKHKKRW